MGDDLPTQDTAGGAGPCNVFSGGLFNPQMKAFFVGDNRTNANWGRAASIALRELLTKEFEIAGCVKGELFDLSAAEAGFVGTLTPPAYYGLYRRSWNRRSRWPFSWYVKLESLYGAKDFIDEEPAVSVERLLSHKHQYRAFERIYREASEADAVVIDGDGDIILSTPPRRQTLFILAMIELGLRLKKPVFVVNSMISDCPSTGRNARTLQAVRRLFAECKGVSLRDPESLRYVRTEIPAAKSRFIPDSLFAWYPRFADGRSLPPNDGDVLLPYPERVESWGKLDFSQPYICIGGGARAGGDSVRAAHCYGRLVDAIAKLGLRVYLTQNDVPDAFLQFVANEKGIGLIPVEAPIVACGSVLANARLFISGRYHPSIFASLGGTPCIFLGSHAHKMGSLAQVLEYDDGLEFDAFPSDSDIKEIVSTARNYLGQGEALRARIRQVAKTRCDEVGHLPSFLKEELEKTTQFEMS
jgi:polysaccharide pyruvyl transferase WcaK-like protein